MPVAERYSRWKIRRRPERKNRKNEWTWICILLCNWKNNNEWNEHGPRRKKIRNNFIEHFCFYFCAKLITHFVHLTVFHWQPRQISIFPINVHIVTFYRIKSMRKKFRSIPHQRKNIKFSIVLSLCYSQMH